MESTKEKNAENSRHLPVTTGKSQSGRASLASAVDDAAELARKTRIDTARVEAERARLQKEITAQEDAKPNVLSVVGGILVIYGLVGMAFCMDWAWVFHKIYG